MKIIDHLLCQDDGTPYPFRETPNIGDEFEPEYLVMHYTASTSAEEAIRWLTQASAKASAHLVISRNGDITQLVPFNVVAWHAGKSSWQGLVGMNQYSIGIELDNAGILTRVGDQWYTWNSHLLPKDQVVEAAHKSDPSRKLNGWHLYTPKQLYVALEVGSLLMQHYHLKDVIGHEDIAPRRKTDPGPAFPMDSFRSRLQGRSDNQAHADIYRTTANLHIRTGAGSQYQALPGSPLPKGTQLESIADKGEWKQVHVIGQVKGITDMQGWVNTRFIELVTASAATPIPVPAPVNSPAPPVAHTTTATPTNNPVKTGG